ncbi:piezo-type mechanosensitive ion channel component 2 isoform X2 [Mugil cephalus]|uniref:piezo-type mechanosensitive ion channel component 2 isoform X2 n=1 Tax=Mugil cephalus TaxID=48193 RepID=UPI001FB71CA0|nr:piezo-type mechanosensitive ion channel component 2 isoform X2 [Mugil cephalus]
MASEVVCGLVFRLLLPLCLVAACLFRYNALSFVYLIYLLLIPLFPEPTSTTMQGHTGRLLQSLCFTSMSFLLLHIIYQITINSLVAGNYTIASDCSTLEKSIRQIGFESVIGADAGNGIRVFIPDIGMFVAGLAIWLLCRSLVQKRPPEDMAQYNADFEAEEQEEEEKLSLDDNILLEEDLEAGYEAEEDDDELEYEEEEEEEDGEYEEEEEEEAKESTKMKILRLVAQVASKVKEVIGNLITTAGKVVVTILLGMTGIILPSLTSFVYFSIFLFLCTWWSLCKTFNTLLFSCMCVLMAIFSAGHLIVLYLYQFQFFQESIPPGDSYISVFGISPIIQSNCSYTWKIIVHPQTQWFHFVSPIMLLILYYTLATLIRLWLQEPVEEMMDDKDEDLCEEEQAGNRTNSSANRKRQMWWESRQGTDEKNGVPTSNGTSFDFVATENGPVCLDLYSTPQYKMDQASDGTEKKDECVYEVCLPPEDSVLKESDTEENEIKKRGVGAMVKIFHFIMKQSYICALIAMMVWSITYVSWLSFVFLMWSCALWMVRDRRRYAMLSSPFMVAYGNLLIVLQYIYMFENMTEVSGISVKKNNPFHSLSSKVLCMLSFWLLLRQTLTERQEKQKEDAASLSDVHVEDEKKKKEEDSEEGEEQDIMQVLGNMLMAMLVKYWIYICGGMFFFVSFEGKIVMYKIMYMMMLLFCVALYQVHYEWWRRILRYFWMSVVMYTMLVLTLVYTSQFNGSVENWSKMLNMHEESLKDLGIEKFALGMLFTRICIPTSFLLVCILHLHYFHDRFLQLTDLQAVVAKEESTIYRLVSTDGSLADLTLLSASSVDAVLLRHREEPGPEEQGDWGSEKEKEQALVVVMDETDAAGEKPRSFSDTRQSSTDESHHCSAKTEPEPSTEQSSDLKSKWHLVVDRLTVLFLKFLEYFHKLQLFIWWLLEIHIIKIVSCYIVLVSLKEVSLFNYVFLASWAFALPYSQYRPLASSVCSVWTCVIIVCKMLYQLQSIKPDNYSPQCLMPGNYTEAQKTYMNKSLLYNSSVDPANWVGMDKTKDLLGYLRNNLLMLALLAFEVTIYRHQTYFRLRNKLSPPAARIIFHDITRQHLDIGIVCFVKYFINYFFYKFGLETCLLLVVNVIGQRMDFYAMLHAFALIAVMSRRRRKAIAEIWPKYCCFLACMLTFQYFICIGIPPAACKDYPWRFPNTFTDSNVIKWLYIPDFRTRPDPWFLLYDFMLLLCASLQRQVFEDENKAAVRLMAGDNVEICRDLDAASFSVHNPVPDFIHCRSYLDMLKVIMFSYLFWFVLTIIFITGTTRISVFCMGYLVACFYFLLFGGELLLKPIKKILHYWDFLIAYNIFVITMKNILSVLACGYINSLIEKQCWLIQLFSLACTIKGYEINKDQLSRPADQVCELPSNEAGIIWDSICFVFLLLQRRVFMSYYFLHVVADIRASQILASRGAELFQATIVKAVRARLEEEHKSVEQLKRQMERIKVRQQKFKRGKEKLLNRVQESGDGQTLVQEEEEDDDDGAQRTKAKTKKKQWWRPWVDHASMVRSGDYYLFETDSEEEEEEEEKKDEEPPKKSAFQRAIGKFVSAVLALPRSIIKLPKTVLQYVVKAGKFLYHAWIKDPKAALRARSKEKRKFWRRYTKGVRHRKSKKDPGHVTIDLGELSDGQEKGEENKKSGGPDNIIKRVFNIIKFTWVLCQTTVDSFTKWMNEMCREYIDISTVLRLERCMLTREVKKGNVPSRESIHVYYQKAMRLNMSRQASLDQLSEDGSVLGSTRVRRRRGGYPMESQDSTASRDSMSSAYTEATTLISRQSTLEDMDAMPEYIPKTSERARAKLRKVYSMDVSMSSVDSGSSFISSEPTQSVMLYSRQGTTDTIEEVEDEQEDGLQGPWDSQRLDESQVAEPEPWTDVEPREVEEEGEWGEGQERVEDEEGMEDEEGLEAEDRLEDEEGLEAEDRLDHEEGLETEDRLEDEEGLEAEDRLDDEEGLEAEGKEGLEAEDKEGLEDEDRLEDEEGLETEDRVEDEEGLKALDRFKAEEGLDGEDRLEDEEGLEGEEIPEGVEVQDNQERDMAPWESFCPDEGPSSRPEEVESSRSMQNNDFIIESDDGGGEQDFMQREPHSGLLFTPDTDASKTSDADVPPSYSKAVSFDRLEVSDDESDSYRKRRMLMTSDSRSDSRSDIMLPSMTTELTASELLLNKMFYDDELEQSDKFYQTQPLILQLCYAFYNMLVAHSELVCYLVIIINHMVSASCVTLVLPITIFLWAMLSVPRPSKRYWMTAIVFTEVTIVIKYFFQFGFFPFNQNKIDKNKPFHPPNIIGVEKKDGYVHYDLVQLLALFFHRSILKCHGLWDEDDPKGRKEALRQSESEDEGKDQEESEKESEPASSLINERRGSNHTLKSINFGTSIDSGHVQVHFPQQQTHQRRKSSSGCSHISHPSIHSSARSKRGSTASHNSSRKDGSVASIHQKTRKEMIIKKLKEQLFKAKAFIIKRFMEIYLPIRQFFYNLIHPEYSAVTDVYVLMFLADTVDFIIIVFGFWAFGKHSAADITSSLSEDQVPGPFLVMVLIQFGTMVVDRALYLRKSVMGKVIFQVILVFGIHFWMFFILPAVTQKRFSENTVAQMWYFVKCIYFGLSAYQIRCGYPTRVLGNFLTKSYNYVNLFLFQGFRLVPFLTELRAVMDWVWTDTSLSLSSWICVEDIYAHIFILKCWRESEKRYPQPRGQKKKKVVKYGMGGMIVVLLICIVWFPLLFMSLVKSVAGVVNAPLDVSLTITLAGFQPIFTMSAQQKQLQIVEEPEFSKFKNLYSREDNAMQWLEGYMKEDLIIAKLKGSSNSLWTISPPSRANLIDMLNSNEDFPITVSWAVQRNLSLGAKAETAYGKKVTNLEENTKQELIRLLNGTGSSLQVTLTDIFPRFIRAPSDSDATPVEQLYKEDEKFEINLSLKRAQNYSDQIQEWWIVNQTRPGPIEMKEQKYRNEAGLDVYIFSDQVSPPSLGFLAGYGIMGLYASVVLVIGKFVREFFSGISHTIMFEELPNVDRILKLCTDIFLVRETGELDLEEDMYAKLIFLYRSPETMIKWTREKTQ